MNESELLAQIKTNPAAFREFFDLYYKPIFGYIFRRTGIFDDTADIASETFLKAFNNISKFNYRGISVKVWLYRIATNEVNLYFRDQRKYKHLFECNVFDNPEIFSAYLQEDKHSLENELLHHRQFLSVLENLKRLPIKYQEVIALRYFEEKDNKEITEILNMKEGTIKSLLSRGLEKLRTLCEQTV